MEILAAAIYLVSKQQDIPVFIEDLVVPLSIDKTRVLRAYKLICRALEIKVIPRGCAENYIIRICSDLGLNGAVPTVAIKASKKKVTPNPTVLAAACVYLSASILRKGIKQREIARYARVSEPALRENFNKLLKRIDVMELKNFADGIKTD